MKAPVTFARTKHGFLYEVTSNQASRGSVARTMHVSRKQARLISLAKLVVTTVETGLCSRVTQVRPDINLGAIIRVNSCLKHIDQLFRMDVVQGAIVGSVSTFSSILQCCYLYGTHSIADRSGQDKYAYITIQRRRQQVKNTKRNEAFQDKFRKVHGEGASENIALV